MADLSGSHSVHHVLLVVQHLGERETDHVVVERVEVVVVLAEDIGVVLAHDVVLGHGAPHLAVLVGIRIDDHEVGDAHSVEVGIGVRVEVWKEVVGVALVGYGLILFLLIVLVLLGIEVLQRVADAALVGERVGERLVTGGLGLVLRSGLALTGGTEVKGGAERLRPADGLLHRQAAGGIALAGRAGRIARAVAAAALRGALLVDLVDRAADGVRDGAVVPVGRGGGPRVLHHRHQRSPASRMSSSRVPGSISSS